jgi:hypothetical protein
MAEAGPAIFLTSFTNLLAFLCSSFLDFPAVRSGFYPTVPSHYSSTTLYQVSDHILEFSTVVVF